MSEPLNDGSMDLPYESQDETPLTDHFLVSGGVVTMAATVEVGGVAQPACIFRFAAADGSGFAPPVMLCVTDEQMLELGAQVTKACNDAVRTARDKRKGNNDG